MAEMTRRDAMAVLAAMMAGGGAVWAQTPQGGGASAHGKEEAAAVAAVNAPVDYGKSRVYRLAEMPLTKKPNGGWTRTIGRGVLPTGEVVEAHESMVPVGEMPHPPHQHRNSEFVMLRQGEMEFLNEGVPERVGVGDVIYTASGKLHGMRNVGKEEAIYFVVSVSAAG